MLAIVRAHVTALGGNAMVAYFMTECILNHNLHKNQVNIKIGVRAAKTGWIVSFQDVFSQLKARYSLNFHSELVVECQIFDSIILYYLCIC